MKILSYLLISTFFSTSLFALSDKQIKRLEEACVCRIQQSEFSSSLNYSQISSNSSSFTKKEEFKTCLEESIAIQEDIYTDTDLLADKSDKQLAKLYEKKLKDAAKDESNPICSRSEIKNWYKELEDGFENKPAVYKALVEQDLCEAEFCEGSDSKGNPILKLITLGDQTLPNTYKYCNVNKKATVKEVKRCSKALGELAVNNRDEITKSCSIDLTKVGKAEALKDSCVELNTYKSIYLQRFEQHELNYCIGIGIKNLSGESTEENSKAFKSQQKCLEDVYEIQKELFEQVKAVKNKVDYCDDSDLFHSEDSTAVCRSILLNKFLGFHPTKEKVGLYACVSKQDAAGIDSELNKYYKNSESNSKKYVSKIEGNTTEECFNSYITTKDPKEATELQKIEDEFCAQEIGEESKKSCLKQVLALFMNDLEVPNDCKNKTDEAEKQKCIRKALYEKALASKELNAGKCWDLSIYSESSDRQKCLNSALKFQKYLANCYPGGKKTTDPLTHEEAKCLFDQVGNNQEDFLRLEDFLKNKAAKIDPEKFKICMSDENKAGDYLDCLGYITDMDTSKDKPLAGMYSASSCIKEGVVFKACMNEKNDNLLKEKQYSLDGQGPKGTKAITVGTNGTNGTSGANGTEGKSGNSEINGNSNNAAAAKTIIVAGTGVLAAGSAKNNFEPGKGSGVYPTGTDPMALADNKESRKKQFFGIFRDFKYIGIRGKEAPCSSLRKAAWVRVGSLVLGLGTITAAGIKAAKMIKNGEKENRKQDASWEAAGVVLLATGTAVGMRALGNVWAKNIVEKAKTQELQRLSTPGNNQPIYCKKDAKKKTSFFNYDVYNLKNISKAAVSNIETAKTHKEINYAFDEWESYYHGEELASHITSEEELDSLFIIDESIISKEKLKATLIASIKGISGFIVSDANADNEIFSEGKGGIKQLATEFMPLLLKQSNSLMTNDETNEEGSPDYTQMSNDQSRALANTIDKKLEGDLSKYQAIDLLADYGITLGTDMPDFEKAKVDSEKNIADFEIIREANGLNSNPTKPADRE